MINSTSKVNAITSTYVTKFGLVTQKTDISIQKIDSLALIIYIMILSSFLVYNKLKKVQFFEKTFLLAKTNMKKVLEKLFLTPLNTNIQFMKRKLE